ncbi:MAG: 30S ribosomal protein S6e [Thermoplasmata archaeon]
MVEFQVVIADTKEGKSYQRKVEGHHANSLIGKKIGNEVDGIFVGLPGFKLEITGGSDLDGVPMKKNLPGPGRKKILGKGGIGFRSNPKNVKVKKTLRGNSISTNINQINMKIIQYGPKKIEEAFEEEQGESE